MYLIVGLGNPEPEYSKTRHNMGFDVINILAEKYNIEVSKKEFEGLFGIGEIEGEKVMLLKPQTYMNESGNSIVKAKNFYKINSENIIIIYDDIDLDVGIVKLRKKGGAGTHNGMKSVIECIGTNEFPHVRVGTGKPIFKELLIQHVLEKLSDDKYKELIPSIEKAMMMTVEIIKNNIDMAMNKYN